MEVHLKDSDCRTIVKGGLVGRVALRDASAARRLAAGPQCATPGPGRASRIPLGEGSALVPPR
jgi:hypothetical protein